MAEESINRTIRTVLDGAMDALKEHAKRAGAQGAIVLENTAKNLAEIAKDTLNKSLSFDDARRAVKNAELAAETRLAIIASQQAKNYVKSVIGLILGGVSDLFASFDWKP